MKCFACGGPYHPATGHLWAGFESVAYCGRCYRHFRIVLPGLSQAEKDARAPMRPEDLVGALQDRIHRDSNVVRAARSAKAKGRG